jgi:hypothetical protein
MEGKTLAAIGDRARFVITSPATVVASSSGRCQFNARLDADRHRTIDHHGTVRLGDTGHHDVVLVGNITDDLLQNVFQRYHALDLAILVDDERK